MFFFRGDGGVGKKGGSFGSVSILNAAINGGDLFKGERQEVSNKPQCNCPEGKDFPLRRTSIFNITCFFWLNY